MLAACGARSGLRVPPHDAGPCPVGIDDTLPATLEVAADDQFQLYVNGTLVDATPRPWTAPQRYAVMLFRHPSRRNVIAIQGRNSLNTDGHDRGVLADLTVMSSSGTQHVLTDATWRISTSQVDQWFSIGFDDSSWPTATDEGPHGEPPWGALFGTSSAHWIWSFDSSATSASKPVDQTVWVRSDFWFDREGSVTEGPSACD